MPKVDDIDRTGLEEKVTREDMEQLLAIDVEGWKKEVEMIKEHYKRFGSHLPKELEDQLAALEARLG